MKCLIKASSLARNTSTWDPHGWGQEKDVGESETVQHNKYNAFIYRKSGVQGSKTIEERGGEVEGGGREGDANLAHNNGAVYCKFKIRQRLPDSTYNPLHAVDFLP